MHNYKSHDVMARLRRVMTGAAALSALGAVALPDLSHAQAQAQSQQQAQEAVISGRVVDAQSGQPIADAQVVALGTARLTRTGPNGNFRLSNMRGGTYRVQARLIGYRSSILTVQVETGGVVQADFSLHPSAVPLDEFVVTGQPAALARREIGTAIATIDAEAIAESRAVQTVSQLLQSRAPGVQVAPLGGKPGQGSRITLRGPTAFMEVAQPIIYVDGVRIDNWADPGIAFGGNAWSGFEDFAPEDIERVEIVRGAAASTLYGTEAANGVIQIFTKQGRGRTTQWNLGTQFGMSATPANYWVESPNRDYFVDEFTRSGLSHRHYGSVRGTMDRFSYFASATRRDEQGTLRGSEARQHNIRANMRVTPSQRVSLQINTGFTERRVRLPYDGNTYFGLGLNAFGGGAEGVGVPPEEIMRMTNQMSGTRYTSGATVYFTPWTNFSHRLTAGADIINSDNTSLHPYGTSIEPFDATREGQKANYKRENRTYTIDYIGQFIADLTPAVRSTTSFGFQGYQSEGTWNFVRGQRFVGPGLITVGAAASTYSTEERLLQKQAGFLVDEQISFNELLYITMGLRLDGHSGFSRDDRYQLYPKVAVSYVASEHGYVPGVLGTLRLRGAFGVAGQQPAGLQRIRTWVFTPATGGAGITTGNYGDPTLRPEISREFEAGFDAGVLNDRVAVEFTFYNQRTANALAPVRYPPSSGFVDVQLENVGVVENQGIELTGRTVLLDSPGFRWELNGTYFTNRNKVARLDTGEDVHIFGAQWVREGYPIAGFFDGDQFLGPAFPTRTITLGSDFRMTHGIGAHFLLDHRGGHYLESNTLRALDQIESGSPSELSYVRSADSWRLREIGLSWGLPASTARLARAQAATLTLTARNVWRQQDYRGNEVEAHFNSLELLGNQTMFDTPLPRQIYGGLTVTF